MDTEELTTMLREATGTLDPPPGFTDTVLRGGRRRRFRRRMAVAASVLAVIAVAAGGTFVVLGGATTQVADQTRGDLASDQGFLDQAVAAWEAGKARSPNAGRGLFDDLRGDPHVYWAGNTPAGRAAVVTEETYLHPHDDMPPDVEREQTLVGLVAIDQADGKLKLVNDQYRTKSDPPSGYFQFGPGDRTLLFVDYGTPIFVSAEPVVRDGTVLRKWQRVPVKDGVAVTQLPADVASTDLAAIARDTLPAPDDLQPTGRFSFWPASDYLVSTPDSPYVEPHRSGLQWQGMDVTVGRTDGPRVEVADVFTNSVSMKVGTGYAYDIPTAWYIRAGLPDGRVAVLGDQQSGVRPAQIYAVLVSPDQGTSKVLEGEVVDQQAVLPVKFRMPDRQGWVVANYGKQLKYRTTSDGAWQDAGTSAALVPDETVQVMVDDKVVDLPR